MATQTDARTQVASARKGRMGGIVNELSVFLKLKPGHEQQVREVFAGDDADAGRPAHAQKLLDSVGTLHEARMVLFDNGTRLLIATSFDGDWDVYIDDFARTLVLQDWERLLIHCEGYPDDPSTFSLFEKKEFLTANQVTAARYDRAYGDLTSKQIVKAQRVQAAFQQLLDEAST